MARGGGSGGVGAVDIRGLGGRGVVQNRESPDFRSPEVSRYALMCLYCYFRQSLFPHYCTAVRSSLLNLLKTQLVYILFDGEISSGYDFLSLFTGKRLANFNPCFSQLCSLLRWVAVSCMLSSEYLFIHFNQFSHLICGNKQNSF